MAGCPKTAAVDGPVQSKVNYTPLIAGALTSGAGLAQIAQAEAVGNGDVLGCVAASVTSGVATAVSQTLTSQWASVPDVTIDLTVCMGLGASEEVEGAEVEGS